ncbi:unnamed protein product [Brassica oleracea var. botrytis]
MSWLWGSLLNRMDNPPTDQPNKASGKLLEVACRMLGAIWQGHFLFHQMPVKNLRTHIQKAD